MLTLSRKQSKKSSQGRSRRHKMGSAFAPENEVLITNALVDIAKELKRLNDNLEQNGIKIVRYRSSI